MADVLMPKAGRNAHRDEGETRSERWDARRALWAISRHVQASLINRALLLAVTLVALDCLIVVRFQVEPALALVRHTPPLTLFIGVILNLAPIVASYVIAASLVGVAFHGAEWRLPERTACAVAAITTFLVSNAVLDARFAWSDAKFFGWAAVALTVAIALNHAIERGLDEGVSAMMLIGGLGVVAVSLVTDPATRRLLERPFVPPERLELEDSDSDDVVGYVLDVDESGLWTTVLDDATRQVIMLPSSSIAQRTVCTLDEGAAAPRRPIVEPAETKIPSC